MFRQAKWALSLSVVSLVMLTSCATRQAISTSDDLLPVLESIPVGKSRYVQVAGILRPYSGKFPKGATLKEFSIGSRRLLIHWSAEHQVQEEGLMNKTVSALVRISHFPMPDSNPSSQIAGTWITEIKDLQLVNPSSEGGD